MQNKNKIGGILDRRFGENDPSMAPEEKMMERFIMEKQRRHKNSSAFDLEEDYEPGELTHMGQSLSFDGPSLRDDFDEDGLSDAEDHPSDEEKRANKRRRSSGSTGSEEDEDVGESDMPERKKTKQEVMKEVMAKSKLYKYERQAAKEDDDDLREELDKELPMLQALLRGTRPKPTAAPEPTLAGMNPARMALMNGTSKEDFDKEYDKRVRQLAQDAKAKPTEKFKPEEERLAEESKRLQQLETKRLKRMQGEEDDSDAEKEADTKDDNSDNEEEEEEDDVDEFGLGAGIKTAGSRPELGVEDEDDFLIDDDLVANGSNVDSDEYEPESESEKDEEDEESDEDDEDDEFTNGLLTKDESSRPEFLTGANGPLGKKRSFTSSGVIGDRADTFPCPQSHAELLEITKNVAILDLPIVFKQIRHIYDPKLNSENKALLGKFAESLVDHISYLANQADHPPFAILETLIRYIHSMSKMFPVEIANTFRKHLLSIHKSRALALNAGDLVILTAIGTIFPTSDHFHQVVTPAILTLGRYLGQKIPQTLADYATAAYVSTLAIQYQHLSKRYVPETVNSIFNALCVLAPTKLSKIPGNFPCHEPKQSLRCKGMVEKGRNLTFFDTALVPLSDEETESLKVALLETNIKLLEAAADTWSSKSAFTEAFDPSIKVLQHLQSKACRGKLPESSKVCRQTFHDFQLFLLTIRQSLLAKTSQKLAILLAQSKLVRRPLELHHHRPLAIKTQIPKFEESFNPDKHYDPNRELAEVKKERALLKKETKKMMRDVRKDSNFVAREQLREKRLRDEAHDKKQRHLIAEIQQEAGMDKNEYEREKEWRKKKSKN